MPIVVGDTFLVQTGSPADPNANHLLVAITDIATDAGGMLLFFPFDTIRPAKPHDRTCEISPADAGHPFITKDSFINYAIPAMHTAGAMLRKAIPGPDGNPTRQRLSDGV